jgi:tetratricopeptide (TPR) repeat protein
MANERASVWSIFFFLLLFAGILWMSWMLSGNPTETAFDRGRKSLGSDNWNRAITLFTRVIEAYPKYSAAYANRAMAERKLEEYDAAISDCNRAIEINPHDDFAFVERGMSKVGKGDPGSAISDFLHAVSLDPTNSFVFYGLGEADNAVGNSKIEEDSTESKYCLL